MQKHTIKADGAPFNLNGTPRNEDKSTAGDGRALCSCGWVSSDLPTRAARKEEHAAHKNREEQVATDAAVQEQAEWDAAAPEDLLGYEDVAADTRVDYTSGRFWDTLGTGSTAIVAALGGSAQALKEDRRTTYLSVAGPEDVQERASTWLPQLWRDAHDALNERRREQGQLDADAAWSFGREFMTDFVAGVVSVVEGKRGPRNPSVGFLAGRVAAQGV